MVDVIVTKYDIVEIPKKALKEWWPKLFEDVWNAAIDGNTLDFQREGRSERIYCEHNRALLRRGDEGKTYLLRQNW